MLFDDENLIGFLRRENYFGDFYFHFRLKGSFEVKVGYFMIKKVRNDIKFEG